MEWNIVRDYLSDQLISRMPNMRFGKDWIDALGQTQTGVQLGISMAIDIRSHALDPQIYIEILDRLRSPISPAAMAFAEALTDFPNGEQLLAASAFPQNNDANDARYARLLDLGSFVRYYLTPSYGYMPYEEAEIRHLFLQDDLNLDDIDVVWSGPRGIVWVIDFTELERLVSTSSPSIVADAYGIELPDVTELVYILYPSSFEETIRCVQPTALDVQWFHPDTTYISFYVSDGWGRTRSLSGTCPPLRERVHKPFSGPLEGFSVGYIGIAEPITKDPDSIVQEAYKRFASVLDNNG